MPVLSASTSRSSNMSGTSSIYIFGGAALFCMVVVFIQQRFKNHRAKIIQSQLYGRNYGYDDLVKSSKLPLPMSSALPEKTPLPATSARSTSGPGDHEEQQDEQRQEHFQLRTPRPETRTDFEQSQPRILRKPQSLTFKPLASEAGLDPVSSRGSSLSNPTTAVSSTTLLYPSPPAPSISSVLPGPLAIQTRPASDSQVQVQDRENHQMIFVPSPTVYTSFEALYSQNPPYSSEPADFPVHPTVQDLPRRRSYTKSLSTGGEISGEIVISSSGVEGQQWRRHTRVFGGGVCRACEESERRLTA